MATISNTPRPGYAWDATDNVWYPIGTGPHTHADYITSSSAINPTIVDAKGDIIAATAADTVARLAVGANGTTLVADSAEATGLKWATASSGGGMTLISTTTLSGTSTTLSSIPQTYNSLFLIITGLTSGTSDKEFRCLPNSSVSNFSGSRLVSASAQLVTNNYISLSGGPNVTRTDANNGWALTFNNYTSTAYKPTTFYGRYLQSGGIVTTIFAGGVFTENNAITSLVFDVEGGNSMSTGTVLLYGVK
jgi:hypothetical protein